MKSVFSSLTTVFIFTVLVNSKAIAALPLVYNPQNVGVVEISKPENYSKIFVISDIKGSYIAFYRLLIAAKLIAPNGQWIGENSLLIINGNLLGAGDQNISLIDLVMSLQPQAQLKKGDVVALLGEQEAGLLSDPAKYVSQGLKLELAFRHLGIQELLNPQLQRSQFLRNLPAAARVGKVLFIHSGLYPNMVWPQFKLQVVQALKMGNYPALLNNTTILKSKDWSKDESEKTFLLAKLYRSEFYSVVFGHSNSAFGALNEVAAFHNSQFIKVDSGMGKDEGGQLGKMLIFMEPAGMNLYQRTILNSLDSFGVRKQIN